MNLVIRALSLNDQPLGEALLGSFDVHGGTIGRSEANTLALPDPERHISRLQAEVVASDGGYTIRNAGGANAIFLNGRALAPGEAAKLAHRDELHIGGYVLRVQLEDDNGAARTISRAHVVVDARTVIAGSAGEHRTGPRRAEPRAAAPVAAAPAMPMRPASTNPFADLVGPAPTGSTNDPFALLDGAPVGGTAAAGTSRSPSPSASRSPTSSSTPSSPSSPSPARLPDDFDPFADLDAPEPPVAAVGPAGASPDLLAAVGASSGLSSSLDEAFGLHGVSRAGAPDPLAAFMAAPSPGVSRAPGVAMLTQPSTDPLAMFAPPADAAAEPHRAAAFNHTAELQAAYSPPRIVNAPPAAPASPATTPVGEDIFAGLGLSPEPAVDPFAGLVANAEPAPAAAAVPAARPSQPAEPASSRSRDTSAASADTEALWSAFCEGAGIRVALPHGLTVQQMNLLGQVMREAVDGTLRLMTVRATAKQELRAAVTTIRSRNNNPLKFSPDAQVAVEQLVQPPVRGFMSAPAAMQDAMHDLVGHSIGTMAGMRAALAGVLGRFEPQQLAAKLADKTMLDSLLAMNRKAKLWDLYLQHFEAIRNEAQDDFHTLFGKAFVAAYEEQLDRLPHRSEGPT
jgi:FHA domain-containing protein